MVNLEHLQVIDTICVEGSFQKASEKLHKARSAVSYSVKQVESYYGVQLFNRQTYRPELTNEGRLLITKIRQLLRQAGEFESFVKQLSGAQETELKLGVGSLFPIEKITDLLLGLRTEFPQTALHLEIEIASGERMLLSEQVDIAIYGAPNRNPAIDYKPVDKIDIPLVVAPSLLKDKATHLRETDLASLPQVVVKSTDRKSPDTHIIDEALKWYVTDLSSKKALLTAGLGWGRMPLHFVEKEIADGSLMRLDIQGEIHLPIYITKLKNKPLGPVAHAIWNHFEA